MRWFLNVLLAAVFLAAPNAGTAEDPRQTDGPPTFEEAWLGSIVSIEESQEHAAPRPLGTGFLVRTGHGPVLLCTAKHVVLNVSGGTKPDLTYRLVDRTDRTLVLHEKELRKEFGAWYVADHDDLSCRFIASARASSLAAIATDAFMKMDRLRVTAPVMALGFPLGLRSLDSPKAIVRGGIVARIDGHGILLDVMVFHGSSGSPVITVQPANGMALDDAPALRQHALIGIVTGFVPYRDHAVTQHAGNPHILSITGNAGLATAVPADRLLTLLDRTDVKEHERVLSEKN
jgi:hypothetical protein